MSIAISYIDCGPLMAELLDECGTLVEGIEIFRGDASPSELRDRLRDARVVLNGHTTMDAGILAAAPLLRSIVFLGTGASSYVDMTEAARRGIAVRVVRNYGDRTIAEHAFGLLLAAARDFARMDRDIRAGRWDAREGVELAGKTLGVVGVGAVGAEMVRIAAAFGMRVVAWNRSTIAAGLPCETMPLDELLAAADAVSIHPALDVFLTEPLPTSHPLAALPNVTLSAHAAWKSREASLRLLRESLRLAQADAARIAADLPLAT